MAVVDYFLKLDGIKGESIDSKHKDEIEIDSFSWGMSNTVARAGGGGSAGRAQFQDFHFTTSVNKSSPLLLLKCANGQHLKQAVLTARKAGDKPVEFLHLKLTDVLVSSYHDQASNLGSVVVVAPPGNTIGGQIGGAAQTTGTPTDAVALRYQTAQVSMNPTQVTIPPRQGAAAMLSFDPATNTFKMTDAPGGVFTVGSVGGIVSRAAMEFDVAILIGLLTNPFSATTLTLEIREAAAPPPPPTDGPPVNAASLSVAPSTNAGPQPHLFDAILYTPADGTLTVEDLTRPGTRVGTLTVDPNGPPASSDIDLTDIVRRRHLESFGIRLQLRGARVPQLDDNKDGQNDDSDKQDGQADGAQGDGARANGDQIDDKSGDNKNEDKNDDEKKTPPADFSASFTFALVLDT